MYAIWHHNYAIWHHNYAIWHHKYALWLEFLPKLARFAPGFPRRPGRRPARILRGSDLAGSVSAGDPVAPRGGATGGSRGESSQLR